MSTSKPTDLDERARRVAARLAEIARAPEDAEAEAAREDAVDRAHQAIVEGRTPPSPSRLHDLPGIRDHLRAAGIGHVLNPAVVTAFVHVDGVPHRVDLRWPQGGALELSAPKAAVVTTTIEPETDGSIAPAKLDRAIAEIAAALRR